MAKLGQPPDVTEGLCQYRCPYCRRYLLASDSPPGFRIKLPRCGGCGRGVVLTTEALPAEQSA